MPEKSLDCKLARILADSNCRDFVLADAKDADMAFGLSAPGRSPEYYAGEARFRTLDEYRGIIRDIVAQGLVDIMLMSASTNEILTIEERLFDNSHITPAVRANDTTDIWLAGGAAQYGRQPSLPFRTATIDHIQCGKRECGEQERGKGANLGLYSVTFNNDAVLDRQALETYKTFRLEAESRGFRHFLEVFDPNAPAGAPLPDMGRFLSDHIVRALAGVTSRGRPLFLKIPYHGPAAMEALARYDRNLVVGILGGSAGTTFDAFQMLWEAKKYGAGSRCTAAKSTTQNINSVLSAISAPWPTTRSSRKKRCARITAISRNSASRRIVRWRKTFSRPRRPAAIADRAVRRETGLARRCRKSSARRAGFQQDVAGRKESVESRSLEADRGIAVVPRASGPRFTAKMAVPLFD